MVVSASDYLVDVQQLSKEFWVNQGYWGVKKRLCAVNTVSFQIKRGETLGLVGESGCGKTTLGRALLRLIEPSAGRIIFDGRDITRLSDQAMRAMRCKMQIIFQDPYAALNPSMTVQAILEEPLRIHGLATTAVQRKQRIEALLEYVHLPKGVLYKYPHEFSGGQRQRICIARALAVEPEFIVCDESVSALDVSIQAQIVNVLMDLQKELGLTYLFITHDLNVVSCIAHHIAVMYLGNLVEIAPAALIVRNPQHPYTKALFSAVPTLHPTHSKKRIILQGDVPSPIDPPTGCPFHPRCWRATACCQVDYPPAQIQANGHQCCCYHPLGDTAN